jgi:ubiquitin fusion degradation protein 1
LDGGFEAFKGRGETLNGRKTKGKGVRTGGRKIAEVAPESKIERTECVILFYGFAVAEL